VAKPQALQRQRRKGWRLPPNTICVTRPGRWGNRYYPGSGHARGFFDGAMRMAQLDVREPRVQVQWFREWLEDFRQNDPVEFEAYIAPLRGKNLACWCALNKPCHRSVLLEYAALPSRAIDAEPGESVHDFARRLQVACYGGGFAFGRFNDRLLESRPGMEVRDIVRPWDDAQRKSYSER
jgi:hypothetical protein